MAAKRRRTVVRGASAWRAAAAVGVLGTGAGLAAAHAAPPARDVAPQEAAPQIEQMTVTARRRTERQQKVPAAITTLSSAELKRRGVVNTNDLQQAVPSLTIGGQQRSNSQFYLRGQTPGVINQGVHNNSSVTVYFLEVPTLVSGPGTFYDMQDVQVLKGPQGTLFGRNTTGGAILFGPVQPKDEISGYIQGRYGSYNDREVEGALNFPLIKDKLDLRVSGALARRDGFTTNVITGQKLDDRDYDAYRVSLKARISDHLDNLLVLDGRNIDQNGTSAIPIRFNPNVVLRGNIIPGTNTPLTLGGNKPSIFCLQGPGQLGVTTPLPGCPSGGLLGAVTAGITAGGYSFYPTSVLDQVIARQQALGPRRFASDAIFFDQERSFNATNITTYTFDSGLVLKNIAGYRFNRVNQASDFGGSILPLVRNTNTESDWGEDAFQQASDEFQVQGQAFNGRLNYIIGAYFENTDPGQPTISRAIQFAPDPSYQVVPDFYDKAIAASSVLNYHQFNDKSEAVFGHAEYSFGGALDGLKLAAGIRYTWDQRSASVILLNGAAQCTERTAIFFRGSVPVCETRQAAQFAAPTWGVQLSYQIDANDLAYISLRRGFKSGGFNLPPPRRLDGTPFNLSFGPEYVFSTEVGVKSDWHLWGMAGRTNAAAFHDVYTSIQTSYATVVGGNIAAVVINAGKAHIDGLELEQTLAPTKDFRITGYFSLLRAVYASSFTQNSGVQLEGTQLPYSPIQKYGINGNYTKSLGDKVGMLSLTADYSLQTHYPTADPLDPQRFFKGGETLNLRADLNNVAGRPLDAALIVTNALDRTYPTGGYPIYGLAGFRSNIYNEPRMIVGQLTAHWGPGQKW